RPRPQTRVLPNESDARRWVRLGIPPARAAVVGYPHHKKRQRHTEHIRQNGCTRGRQIVAEIMLINPQTKIATLLKHHPDALETIVMLSPDFKKLRNPILRKLMAGRTSIAMASKIGGC